MSLTSASRTGLSQTWTYDANGNRLTQGGTSSSTFTIASSSNRLSSVSGAISRTYGYDAAGNTTSYGGFTFTYNDAGRMTGVSGSATASYGHNALGQRVNKVAGGVTTYFVYDEAGHLLGEYDGSGNLIQETVWMEDTPVATLRPNGGSVSIFYVHVDHLNTPRRISRPSDNAILWRWDSDPFGTDAANEDPDADTDLFKYGLRFPGQYFDTETGLSYNYARDYDPAIGRYIESDPIGLRAGLNTFVYVKNQPLRYVDPLGLKARVCCRKIPWLPASHCFVQEEKDDDSDKHCDAACESKKRTLGLQGPPPFGDSDNGGGKKFEDHGFDNPSESRCGEWTSYCELSRCLDQAYADYPDPSVYSGMRGPNSNTFAYHLMSQCKLKGFRRFWPAPGWGQSPAAPLSPPTGGGGW